MDTTDLNDADLDFSIDVGQDWQCKWWAYGFGVSPEDIHSAVQLVGSSSTAVREHLRGRAL